jgi:hypothetical protein
MTPTDQNAIVTAASFLFAHIIADIVLSGFLFGFYFLAFILTLRAYRIQGRSRKVILACISLSFLMCCWDLLASKLPRLLVFTEAAFINSDSSTVNLPSADDAIHRLNSAVTWPFNINLLIGDAIVSWRAYVIWEGEKPGGKLAMYTLYVLMIANAAADIGDAVMDDLVSSQFVILDSVSSFLSFAVNFFATLMITITAWKLYWRMRKLHVTRAGIKLQKLLLFLIESGSSFCVIQLVYAVIQLPSVESNPADVLPSLFIACLCNISSVLYPLAAIAFVDVFSISTPLAEPLHTNDYPSITRTSEDILPRICQSCP